MVDKATKETKEVEAVEAEEESAVEQLSPRHRLFLETYLTNGFNGTAAAKTAKYSGDDHALAVRASQILRTRYMRAALQERLYESAMPPNEVLSRITEIARGDITEFMDDDGNLDIKKIRKMKKGHLLKRLKIKKTKKVVTREAEEIEDGKEVFETSIINEDVDFEGYSAHEALRDLSRFHNIAGSNTSLNITLTPEQVKGLTDEEIDGLIKKLERRR